jgi:hypothetical protein
MNINYTKLWNVTQIIYDKLFRRIFGPKRDEVTGGWRKLHNEELHSLHFLPDIWVLKSRRMRWAGGM